jgi:choline dehydrogenase
MAQNEAVDVVVVGGGAAGCVVAARLSEAKSRSVLLLEAGPDLRSNTPPDLRDGWRITREFDWGLESEPDEAGVVERVRRCRLLGGTSWVTRFAVRGAPADFEEWVDLGNPGWGFEDVLPYFMRLEADVDFGDQPWHGDKGPIPVDRYRRVQASEMGEAATRAIEAVGFPSIDDHNRPGAVGLGRMPMTSREGMRVSVADAYLPLSESPANLVIRPGAQVSHVVFEGTRARGVQLVNGTVIDADWVVISAGAFGSPPILMRSGIGSAEYLRSIGIPVLVDLPGVGANLGDHPGVDVDCGYGGTARTAPVLHSIATFHSETTSASEPPDLMLWVSDPVQTGDGPAAFTIDVVLLKPRSRGSVLLRSADPMDPPRVRLPGVRKQADVDRLAEGYRLGLEVANRPEVRHLCETPTLKLPDPEDLRRMIQEDAYPIPHYVGTCSMGPSADRGAVVDASGRVHGTDRLSVIDASIMPSLPSGFPHLPTIMIAERLSEQLHSVI